MSSVTPTVRSWVYATNCQVGLADTLLGICCLLTTSALHLEKKNLEQKNHELAGAFKEKSRAQQRLQTLYQRVKSQMNAAQMEDAAANDVENVIHSVTTPHFINDVQGAPGQQRHGMVQSRNSNIPQIYRRPRGPGSNASDEKRSAYAWAGQQPALHGSLHSSRE